MRKLLLIAFMLAGTAVHAHGFYHGGYRGYHGGYSGGWVAPFVFGSIAGAVIAREAQPVIIQQPPIIVTNPQGAVIQPPYGYHYENILDANCNCYRLVLVQNQ